MENKIITSSRSVGMWDINALLFAPISRIKTLRDDEGRRGFTLIELLVVVLIIGILASVALPQYQKAVERSRMAEAMQRLGDYASAQQVYYMHNNGFASDYAALNQGDIKVPEQTEVGTWDTDDSRWEIASASGNSLEKVTMSAQRMSGIYKDCVLTLSVEADGHIEKTCSGNADCCEAAKNGGYEEGQTSSEQASNEPVSNCWVDSYSGAEVCKGENSVLWGNMDNYNQQASWSFYGVFTSTNPSFSGSLANNGTWTLEEVEGYGSPLYYWIYTEGADFQGYIAVGTDPLRGTWNYGDNGWEYITESGYKTGNTINWD